MKKVRFILTMMVALLVVRSEEVGDGLHRNATSSFEATGE